MNLQADVNAKRNSLSSQRIPLLVKFATTHFFDTVEPNDSTDPSATPDSSGVSV
jgi:hypothetical protein